MENSYKLIIGIFLGIVIVFILFPHHSSLIAGHPFEVRGQFYDYDPTVPLINTINELGAFLQASDQIIDYDGVLHIDPAYNSYNDFYNQYHYRCFSLKDEGTQAFTIAKSATAGTASREQLINFYSTTLDAIQREENCQRSISVFLNSPVISITLFDNNADKKQRIKNELTENDKISKRDENIEMTNYNVVASNFNSAIKRCGSNDQVIGIDGICHKIASPPNLYYP